jgi:hypothetical protein
MRDREYITMLGSLPNNGRVDHGVVIDQSYGNMIGMYGEWYDFRLIKDKTKLKFTDKVFLTNSNFLIVNWRAIDLNNKVIYRCTELEIYKFRKDRSKREYIYLKNS